MPESPISPPPAERERPGAEHERHGAERERSQPGDERQIRRERREREAGARSEAEGPELPLATMVIAGPDADPCATFTQVPGPDQEPQRTTIQRKGDEWLVLDGTEPAPRVASFKAAVVVAIDAFRQKILNIL